MSTPNSLMKYTEEFKKTIVSLYQSGKTYSQIQREYGVSSSALSNWVRKYSQVKVDDDTILSAQQIKALQKRNAELEEENLYARKVIACRVGNKIDRFLAIETLRDAVRLRGVSRGIMFHTDQGSQFTSRDFRQVIDELGLIQSFSAKAHPYDNAVMECFFKYLKMEELNRRTYLTVEQLKQSLISYISGFYNSRRPHSHNRGLSPNLAEQRLFCIPTCPLY